ncbi:MAG: SprT-like domain-containing protein [Acidobacteriota bacterium]|nr:SprT-like domain-containing protein [Acidobacteriota bacterium]MDH3530180.1 SprT-like domain-containing protein [Acidobacteriota bacterium]
MFAPDEAKTLYREAFETLRKTDNVPEIVVEYYPYVDTNHTIRFRNKKILVRISDSFQEAPAETHKALAYILVAKLLGEKVPPALRKKYTAFVRGESFNKRALDRKRERGSKRVTSPVGAQFDLEEMFWKLNSIYFGSMLEAPELSWSQRKTYRRLGHHDVAHNTIVISRSLDVRGVPEYVVEYVLFHEMLHLVHPIDIRNGRRRIHTKAFRRDESRFIHCVEAEQWLENNAAALKKLAKRR